CPERHRGGVVGVARRLDREPERLHRRPVLRLDGATNRAGLAADGLEEHGALAPRAEDMRARDLPRAPAGLKRPGRRLAVVGEAAEAVVGSPVWIFLAEEQGAVALGALEPAEHVTAEREPHGLLERVRRLAEFLGAGDPTPTLGREHAVDQRRRITDVTLRGQ